MDPFSLYVLIGAAIVVLIIFVFISYVKAPPSFAFIISGLSKEPRVLIGSGGFKCLNKQSSGIFSSFSHQVQLLRIKCTSTVYHLFQSMSNVQAPEI